VGILNPKHQCAKHFEKKTHFMLVKISTSMINIIKLCKMFSLTNACHHNSPPPPRPHPRKWFLLMIHGFGNNFAIGVINE
jgi:hypothetical protein